MYQKKINHEIIILTKRNKENVFDQDLKQLNNK